MSNILDARYSSSVRQRSMEGDMDWSMFPNYLEPPTIVPDSDFNEYTRNLIQDRRDNIESSIEAYTPPLHLKQTNQKLMHHMYGTLNTTDPYTDEDFDTQFRGKDPRMWMIDNYSWNKYLEISKGIAQNYDFAPSGAFYGDSGTNPPDLLQSKMNQSKLWIQALYKNFQEGLDTLNPRGLYAHDPSKVATLHYGSLNSDDIPIQTLNVARRFSNYIAPDIHFRSFTEPTQIPGVGRYGHGIKSAGLMSLKQQIHALRDDVIDKQIFNNTKFIPPTSDPHVNTVLKNALAMDLILRDQEVMTNKQRAYMLPASMQQYLLTDTDMGSIQKTLLPSVNANIVPPPSRMNLNSFERDNIQQKTITRFAGRRDEIPRQRSELSHVTNDRSIISKPIGTRQTTDTLHHGNQICTAAPYHSSYVNKNQAAAQFDPSARPFDNAVYDNFNRGHQKMSNVPSHYDPQYTDNALWGSSPTHVSNRYIDSQFSTSINPQIERTSNIQKVTLDNSQLIAQKKTFARS